MTTLYTPMTPTTLSSTPSPFDLIAKGTKLQVIKNVYDDGEDYHPPGYVSLAGDVVYAIHDSTTVRVVVSHIKDSLIGFIIMRDEFKIIGVET